MLRIAVLTPHYKHSNSLPILPVDHGIGEVMQYVNSSYLVRWRAKSRKLDQQVCHSVEFVKEATCKLGAAFLAIEACRVKKIKLCASM